MTAPGRFPRCGGPRDRLARRGQPWAEWKREWPGVGNPAAQPASAGLRNRTPGGLAASIFRAAPTVQPAELSCFSNCAAKASAKAGAPHSPESPQRARFPVAGRCPSARSFQDSRFASRLTTAPSSSASAFPWIPWSFFKRAPVAPGDFCRRAWLWWSASAWSASWRASNSLSWG